MDASNLKFLLRSTKTLVISCNECLLPIPENESMVIISTSCNQIHPHDYNLKNKIREYVMDAGYTQIVVMGHTDCRLHTLFSTQDYEKPSPPILQKITGLVRNFHNTTIQKETMMRYCIDFNVQEQVNTLMGYDFIKQKVEAHELSVSGVVLNTTTHQLHEITQNGWEYNTLLKLN